MLCPICKKQFEREQTTAPPFCSERCRLIDLGRWLGEDYGLPAVPDPEADELPDDVNAPNGNGEAPDSQ